MNVTLLATCITCDGSVALKNAALEQDYKVKIESVQGSDDRTRKSAELGIGLPVLIREDGAFSDDAVNWLGVEPVKKTRRKKTNPIDEVVENIEDIILEPIEETEDADRDQS